MNLKILLHMCDTYNCYYLKHSTFQLNQFSVKYRFAFPILRFFIVKSPSVTQRSVSQENAYKMAFHHGVASVRRVFAVVSSSYDIFAYSHLSFRPNFHHFISIHLGTFSYIFELRMSSMETRSGRSLSKLPIETMDSAQASRLAINSPEPAVTNNRFSPLASPDSPLVNDAIQSPVKSIGFEKRVMDSLAIIIAGQTAMKEEMKTFKKEIADSVELQSKEISTLLDKIEHAQRLVRSAKLQIKRAHQLRS